jgi:flagellar biosynthetic protein FliQ
VTTDFALQLFGELLLTALFISAPILIPVMVVGLAISILQVVTQVQEISLTFVPKIITVFIAVVVFGPWMLRKLLAFASAAISNAGMF